MPALRSGHTGARARRRRAGRRLSRPSLSEAVSAPDGAPRARRVGRLLLQAVSSQSRRQRHLTPHPSGVLFAFSFDPLTEPVPGPVSAISSDVPVHLSERRHVLNCK